jgi:hypothetical protein
LAGIAAPNDKMQKWTKKENILEATLSKADPPGIVTPLVLIISTSSSPNSPLPLRVPGQSLSSYFLSASSQCLANPSSLLQFLFY